MLTNIVNRLFKRSLHFHRKYAQPCSLILFFTMTLIKVYKRDAYYQIALFNGDPTNAIYHLTMSHAAHCILCISHVEQTCAHGVG